MTILKGASVKGMQTHDLYSLTCLKVLFSYQMQYTQLISSKGVTFLCVYSILI